MLDSESPFRISFAIRMQITPVKTMDTKEVSKNNFSYKRSFFALDNQARASINLKQDIGSSLFQFTRKRTG